MYLKSIEIHGFKSFANKILFEFHEGVTGIVGPNGSGKSNVADAVRWVLGEQSAKQLRGASMQDVIFSGSEARKPLGYAYVEITFDNSDHKLAIEYEEVAVARRVYRSGESEYLINGNVCRLKDVQELFMDTGIGKEGYSIIGQGQIDKILSTKPEDRRELFDEAVGIVKFKKRKQLAEKNLADATDNLVRVNDIVNELEKQIGPLKKQSETAREYLKLKDELRRLEVNNFIYEYEKSGEDKKKLDEKYNAAVNDLDDTKAANENAEAEYKRLEGEIVEIDKALDENRNSKQELLLSIEKNEGEIKLHEQQLESFKQNSERIGERIAEINAEIDEKYSERAGFEEQKKSFDDKLNECGTRKAEAEKGLDGIRNEIMSLSEEIENSNSEILKLVSDRGHVKTNIEHFDTVLEQNNIRKAELTRRLLGLKGEESDSLELMKVKDGRLKEVSARIRQGLDECSELERKFSEADRKSRELATSFENANSTYLSKKSRYDALSQIAERYDGFSGTVKKIMDVKDRFSGICGVVAELVSTDKKYETAVETALGASIQHIVTDNEETAKKVIEYLKENKLGRATFLPITSIGDGRGKPDEKIYGEHGVINDAAALVKADKKYNGIVNHLLKNFIVVDNVDNALKIAKKYDYSVRLVTIEGELLSPGGSIAGGTFKNAGNLLGRKREMEELLTAVEEKKQELEIIREQQQSNAEIRRALRNSIDNKRSSMKDLYVEQNTAKLDVEKEGENLSNIKQRIAGYSEESRQIENTVKDLKSRIDDQNNSLNDNDKRHKELQAKIDSDGGVLMQRRIDEGIANENMSKINVEYANIEQAGRYTTENIERIDAEIEKLKGDVERIRNGEDTAKTEREEKEKAIEELKKSSEANKKEADMLQNKIEELTGKKDSIKKEHKEFLDSWSELTKRITNLEKEVMRLGTQRDKLAESMDYRITYIWEEYQLTVSTAYDYRDEGFKISSAHKDITDCKTSIKALGEVNVNSIEDYKNVSERYEMLTGQRDDLVESKEKILAIIQELDEAMRAQFTERFEFIRTEFNNVFRELFGGGKGELELIEDEDILEAGIRIIAQPPGKKLQNMMQLSGGEKALTAISLLFAIQNLKPSPFCLLDEIEAALDDSNVKRYASYLKKLTKNSQFIVITHRRGTMAAADVLYGITMQEKGVSTLVSVSLIEGDLDK